MKKPEQLSININSIIKNSLYQELSPELYEFLDHAIYGELLTSLGMQLHVELIAQLKRDLNEKA